MLQSAPLVYYRLWFLTDSSLSINIFDSEHAQKYHVKTIPSISLRQIRVKKTEDEGRKRDKRESRKGTDRESLERSRERKGLQTEREEECRSLDREERATKLLVIYSQIDSDC